MLSSTGIENVTPGDSVLLWTNRGYSGSKDTYTIEIVERVTKTQISVNGVRYTRSAGIERTSSDWRRNRIYPLTDENLEEAEKLVVESKTRKRRSSLIYRMCSVSWSNIPLEKLERIASVLDA